MFKVGDEVLIKAKVGEVDDCQLSHLSYGVFFSCGGSAWVKEEDVVEAKAYEKGLADAWELAKKIYDMKCDAIEEIFGVNGGFYEVIRNFTYEDCRDKIEAYEKEKEIKVGDVVEAADKHRAVVTYITDMGNAYIMFNDGRYEVWDKSYLKKVGAVDGLHDLLRQIGE